MGGNIPESTSSSPGVEHGLCICGDEVCYLCEQPINAGEVIVSYDDAAFWDEQLFYHADCWVEADLAAKEFGGDSIHKGTGMLLLEVDCARCARPIEWGAPIVRVPGGHSLGPGVDEQASALPRILHAACFDAVKV